MCQSDRYVMGIDGGGTKTHCALYDVKGHFIDLMEFGASNHESIEGGMEQLPKVLYHMIDSILNKNKIIISQLQFAVFGMAGVDTKQQQKEIESIIRAYGIKDFILCNDSFLGIKSASVNGAGICAINGTGFSVTGINTEGTMHQIGGLGHITGDKGGGTYLMERVVAGVYKNLYNGANTTLIQEELFLYLNITSKSDFIEVVTTKVKTEYRKFVLQINLALYEAANRKDPLAISILEEVGEAYANTIRAMRKELNFSKEKEIEVILAGSQFTKASNQTTINKIKRMLASDVEMNKFKVIVLKEPCVIGAILWALDQIDETKNFKDIILKEFYRAKI